MLGIRDGGSNSIYFKKDNAEKKFYTKGISKEYYGKSSEATQLILKAAKLEMNDINQQTKPPKLVVFYLNQIFES